MTETGEPNAGIPPVLTRDDIKPARSGLTPNASAATGNLAKRGTRYQNRTGTPQTSTSRDFQRLELSPCTWVA